MVVWSQLSTSDDGMKKDSDDKVISHRYSQRDFHGELKGIVVQLQFFLVSEAHEQPFIVRKSNNIDALLATVLPSYRDLPTMFRTLTIVEWS